MYDIEVHNLIVDYSGIRALENINFNIKENEFLCIIGPNGGGKSTLLNVMLNLLKPTEGTVITQKGKSITYVPQFIRFDKKFPIDVWDVILMGSLPSKIKIFQKYNKNHKDKALEIMNKLGIFDLKGRQIGQLSGGQLQKVLIARAIATDADIILFDEPTANLDIKTKEEIYTLLIELKKYKTIVMVTHDVYDVLKYVDTVLCLNKSIYYFGKYEGFDYALFEQAYGYRKSNFINKKEKKDVSSTFEI
ncbi:MAG: metal ABC transporter ATP-binding protein [Eubacteriaceae bacterium]